jgi:hypothetical protein
VTSGREALRDELERLLTSLEAELVAGWMPPTLRADGQRVRGWAREVVTAVEAGRTDDVDELLEKATHWDTWLQDLETFRTLVESGAVLADDGPGTVSIRWDLVASGHRRAAVSLATELVDAYRGRSAGGWPKGRPRG